MTASAYDFEIEQGASFAKSIVWKDEDGEPKDLGDYTAQMDVRDRAGVLKMRFSSEPTGEDSTIALGDEGEITLTATAEATGALFAPTSSLFYDLELTTGADVTRLLSGRVTVSRGWTV